MHIRVSGTPVPQGSKVGRAVYAGSGDDRHFTGRVNVVDQQGERLTSWREAIRNSCQQQRAGRQFGKDVPVSVIAQFYLPRPRYHYGSGRNSGRLKPSAPEYPTGKKNDADKLERALLDGLTDGGAWHDDGQMVSCFKIKLWADDEAPGCQIWLSRAPARNGRIADDDHTG